MSLHPAVRANWRQVRRELPAMSGRMWRRYRKAKKAQAQPGSTQSNLDYVFRILNLSTHTNLLPRHAR